MLSSLVRRLKKLGFYKITILNILIKFFFQNSDSNNWCSILYILKYLYSIPKIKIKIQFKLFYILYYGLNVTYIVKITLEIL